MSVTPKGPRMLKVIRRTQLSEHLIRVCFGGDDLDGFPADQNGAHIKLFFPRPNQSVPVLPTRTDEGIQWPPPEVKPIARTYSVRHFDAQQQELAIDFVDHGDTGPASCWARACQPGDHIGLAGPGGPWPMIAETDHAIAVADLSALPALYASLELKPARTRVQVLVALESEADRLNPPDDANIEWHWFTGAYPAAFQPLLSELRSMPRPAGSLCGWVAGERDLVLAARTCLTQQWGLTKANLYAIPYWRLAATEEDFHQARHTIMDADY